MTVIGDILVVLEMKKVVSCIPITQNGITADTWGRNRGVKLNKFIPIIN